MGARLTRVASEPFTVLGGRASPDANQVWMVQRECQTLRGDCTGDADAERLHGLYIVGAEPPPRRMASACGLLFPPRVERRMPPAPH